MQMGIYDAYELSCALRPYLLRLLLDRGASAAVFTDTDTCFYAPVDDLARTAADAGLALIPTDDPSGPRTTLLSRRPARVPPHHERSLQPRAAGGRPEGERVPRLVGSPARPRLPQRTGSRHVGRPDLGRLGTALLRAYDRARLLVGRRVLEPGRARPGRAGGQARGRRHSASPLPLRRLRSAPAGASLHLFRGANGLHRTQLACVHLRARFSTRLLRDYADRLLASDDEELRDRPYGHGVSAGGRPLGPRERTIYREAVLAAEARREDPPPSPFDPSRIDDFERLVDDPASLRSLSAQAQRRLEDLRPPGISVSSFSRVGRRLLAAPSYVLTDQSPPDPEAPGRVGSDRVRLEYGDAVTCLRRTSWAARLRPSAISRGHGSPPNRGTGITRNRRLRCCSRTARTGRRRPSHSTSSCRKSWVSPRRSSRCNRASTTPTS